MKSIRAIVVMVTILSGLGSFVPCKAPVAAEQANLWLLDGSLCL